MTVYRHVYGPHSALWFQKWIFAKRYWPSSPYILFFYDFKNIPLFTSDFYIIPLLLNVIMKYENIPSNIQKVPRETRPCRYGYPKMEYLPRNRYALLGSPKSNYTQQQWSQTCAFLTNFDFTRNFLSLGYLWKLQIFMGRTKYVGNSSIFQKHTKETG